MKLKLNSYICNWFEEILVSNLNLSIVTDGFNWNGCFEYTVRVPWLQLNYCLCSSHKASYCALILQELFFFFLEQLRKEYVIRDVQNTVLPLWSCYAFFFPWLFLLCFLKVTHFLKTKYFSEATVFPHLVL